MQGKPILLIVSLVIALVVALAGLLFWYIRKNPDSSLLNIAQTTRLGDASDPSGDTSPPETPTLVVNQGATYTGTLPCADCEGIQTTLTLEPAPEDQFGAAYTLSETYLGKSQTPIETTGYWILRNSSVFPNARYSEPITILVLDLGTPNQRLFRISPDTLTITQLDTDGNATSTSQNVTLTAQGATPRTSDVLPIGGEIATGSGNMGFATPPPPDALNAQ